MVLFSSHQDNFWTMGQMLTTKYNFVFNLDKKQIGLYKKVNIRKDNEGKKDYKVNNNINKNLYIFITIIVGLFFCCGLYLGRRAFRTKRKIIVNELIEERNYEYKTHNDEKNKYISINDNNKEDIMIEMNKKIYD